MKWICTIGVTCALAIFGVACGDSTEAENDDSSVLLSTLDDAEMTALCEEACDGRTAYSVDCKDAEGMEFSYRVGEESVASCQSDCEAIERDASCKATVGDVYTSYSVPTTCAEGAKVAGASFALFACSQ